MAAPPPSVIRLQQTKRLCEVRDIVPQSPARMVRPTDPTGPGA